MKYDDLHPDKRMYKRAFVVAVFMLVCLRSWAQQAPWRTDVISPRPALPAVSVDLGYPGPYVPWRSTPITLRATASDYPFDGYIGFHFRVKDHHTYDAPVIARAVLKPHESWTFTTYAHLLRGEVTDKAGNDQIKRELGIEWRDASKKVIGQQPAGRPPWTTWHDPTIPLLVDANAKWPASTLGRSAYAATPQSLPDVARWYAGFSSVVIATDTWLDLPVRVREAVFGSGLPVIFHGFPRSNQQFTEMDRALLPVTFAQQSGTVVVPQPYGDGATQVPMPMSWTPKPFADRVGVGAMPYMVRTPASSWVANEEGIHTALPVTRRYEPAMLKHATPPREARPGPGEWLSEHRSTLVLIFAALTCIAGWVVLRRQVRLIVIGALVLVVVGCMISRQRIRPASEERHLRSISLIEPGLVSIARITASYGSAPIPPASLDSDIARTSLTGATEGWGRTEERTSTTPMLMGTLLSFRDWDGIVRWATRREIAQSVPVRIRHMDGSRLELEYETAFPLRSVRARWACGVALCRGLAKGPGTSKGTVIVENGRWTWTAPSEFDETDQDRNATVVLRGDDDELNWFDTEHAPSGSFIIDGTVWETEGVPSSSFALPVTSMRGDESALVTISHTWAVHEVSIGQVVLQPAQVQPSGFGRSYTIPNDLLHQVLAGGGVVNVRMKATPPPIPPAFKDIRLEIWEKKP